MGQNEQSFVGGWLARWEEHRRRFYRSQFSHELSLLVIVNWSSKKQCDLTKNILSFERQRDCL